MSGPLKMTPRPETTLEEAREWVRKRVEVAVICPCCEQHAKVYRRLLNSSMAYALILLSREQQKDMTAFIHIEKYLKALDGIPSSIRGDVVKLRYWRLLERRPEGRKDGNPRAGYYRMTLRAWKFVRNEIMIEKHAIIYNGRVLRHSDEPINIKGALKGSFDYDEMMKPVTVAAAAFVGEGELF